MGSDDKPTDFEGLSLKETIREVLWERDCLSLKVTMMLFLKGWDVSMRPRANKAWEFDDRLWGFVSERDYPRGSLERNSLSLKGTTISSSKGQRMIDHQKWNQILGVVEYRDLSLKVTILIFDDPELPLNMRNRQVGKCPNNRYSGRIYQQIFRICLWKRLSKRFFGDEIVCPWKGLWLYSWRVSEWLIIISGTKHLKLTKSKVCHWKWLSGNWWLRVTA